MYKPKCILLKLLNTPPLVRVRIVGVPCNGNPMYYVVKRSDNILGWETVGMFDDLERAFDCLNGFFGKLELYK